MADTFTPGPWSIDHVALSRCHLLGASDGFCADIIGTLNDTDTPSGEANARLIAAAPELYEAVEGMLRWRLPHDRAFTVTDGSRAAFDRLEAALASARSGDK